MTEFRWPNAPVARLLRDRYVEDVIELATDWQDEAAQAALDGNPRRAWYLEHMAERLMGRT